MAKGKYRRRNHQEPTQTNEVEQPKQQKKDTMLDDMARLDFENQMAHEQAGKEAPTYGFWGWLYRMQQKHGHNQLHKVNKTFWLYLQAGWEDIVFTKNVISWQPCTFYFSGHSFH